MEHAIRYAKFNPIPRISVSSLGSFTCCQRSGMIAFKKQGIENEQEEPRIPNLGYLPIFDEALLQERFKDCLKNLKTTLPLLLSLMLFIAVIARFGSTSLAVCLSIGSLPLAVLVILRVFEIAEIILVLWKYKRSPETPLDPTSSEPIPITWYGLVRAGYVPIKPGDEFLDDELQLTGQPWRILQKDDQQRIPVIHHSGNNEVEVKRSHRIRFGAYSHLIESQERATSDWGILVDPKTKKGFAMPITEKDRNDALKLLRKFRTVIAAEGRGIRAPIPTGGVCENCFRGKPRRYVKGVSNTILNDGDWGANTREKNGIKVHSECGDVYDWVPPYEE